MSYYNVFILSDGIIIDKTEGVNGILAQSIISSYENLAFKFATENVIKYEVDYDFVLTRVDDDGKTEFVYSTHMHNLGLCSDLGYLL